MSFQLVAREFCFLFSYPQKVDNAVIKITPKGNVFLVILYTLVINGLGKDQDDL